MKRLILLAVAAAGAVCIRASAEPVPLRLVYTNAAPETANGWERQSLPIGNGYFGASVFGGVAREHLVLSHGAVYASKRHGPYGFLPTFTKALDVFVDFPHAAGASYRRSLDLDRAVADVSYTAGGVRFAREFLASYPDKILALRLTASDRGKLAFTLRPEIPYLQAFGVTNGPTAGMGRVGTVVAKGRGIDVSMSFEGYRLKCAARFEVVTDGAVRADGAKLSVADATEATVLLALETNYTLASDRMSNDPAVRGCDPNAPDPLVSARALAAAAARKGWTALRADHVADYRSLFDRVALDLGAAREDAAWPTDQLLLAYRKGRASAYLETVYAQYGRYLLIASSRPKGLPANLQGIWTNHADSPWTGGYWHNINIQMNYWPCFAGNLLDCFEPYAAWHAAMRPVIRRPTIERLQKLAAKHPAIKARLPKDPFRELSSDTWSVAVGEWPYMLQAGVGAASGLTSKLFMEWWNFSQDGRVLRDHAWPAVHGAAQALVFNVVWTNGAWLCVDSFSHEQQIRDPKTGRLGDYYITTGCAFDQQMTHENNADCLTLARLLGTNDAVTAEIARQIGRYEPVLIGGSGQIKEFREEDKYGEFGEYHHRHISQLMALMPGTLVTRDTPEWMEAAKKTLVFRGDESTGWALAHRLNAWARTGDGEHCHRLVRNLLGTRTYENLWDAHPPFQIDGNFGGTSGILEMLIQSHAGYIDLLPALPAGWAAKGSFRGLRARGAFEVSCAWREGKPVAVEVRALTGTVPDVRFAGARLALTADGGLWRYGRPQKGLSPRD